SLLFLAQAWSADGVKRPLHLLVATSGMQSVGDGDAARWPDQATVLGPVSVIPHELADVTVSCIDVHPDDMATLHDLRRRTPSLRRPGAAATASALVEAIELEAHARPSCDVVALRDGQRFVHDIRRAKVGRNGAMPLRRGGVVLVTGGLGGISLAVA